MLYKESRTKKTLLDSKNKCFLFLKLNILFYHKILNERVRINEKNKQTFNSKECTRFQHYYLKILSFKLHCRHNSYFVRLPKIYTKLPQDLVNVVDHENV